MDDTISAVKQYWPWALGILGVVFIASRLGGGSSTADDSSALSGSLYDPNLLANNLAMSQVAAGIQQAQIVADAQNNQQAWSTIQSGFQFASNANSDFQAGQIAAYGAIKDMSVNAANNLSTITGTGMLASSQNTVAFHNMIGTSTQASAQIVSAIAGANAQSQSAILGGVKYGYNQAVTHGIDIFSGR